MGRKKEKKQYTMHMDPDLLNYHIKFLIILIIVLFILLVYLPFLMYLICFIYLVRSKNMSTLLKNINDKYVGNVKGFAVIT